MIPCDFCFGNIILLTAPNISALMLPEITMRDPFYTLRYSTVLTVLTLQFSPVKVYFPAFEKVISKLCAFTYCMSSSRREKRVCTGKSLLRFRLNKLSQGSWNLEIY